MKRIILRILLSGFFLAGLNAFEVQDVQLHLKITGLTEASSPEVWRNFLILTYKPVKPARYIGAAFSNEDYQDVHTYMVNNHGVYFLVLPAPAEEDIRYRVVVDGIWETDPRNPDRVTDRNGLRLSRLRFDSPAIYEDLSPLLLEDSRVQFHFRTGTGRQVYLAGDFNRWDPYMTNMKEKEPGTYSVTLSLKPGRYGYYFLIDGEPVTDPLNFQKSRTPTGENVSILYLPG